MPNIILLGNPGAGKSTLLSSLVEGSSVFPSGISIGRGKTTQLQRVDYQGNTYIDTPGLSDVRHRATAASEIESAFKIGGKFKVFFVLTLESGRVKPDDLATIKLVLDAVPQIGNNQYSILINKISPQMVATLNERDELETYLVPPSVGTSTRSIFYIPINHDWIDQANQWGPLSQELLSFVANAPEIEIVGEQVQPIQHSQFENVLEAIREEVQSLREDNAALRRALAEREKKLSKFRHSPSHSHFGPSTVPKRQSMYPLNALQPTYQLPLQRALSHDSHLSPRYSVLFIGDFGKWEGQYRQVPGFSGSRSHNKAVAKDIIGALKGKLKIFFIMTMEHDKIKPEHLATMKLVLRAAPQIKDQFSIITNMPQDDKEEEWKKLVVGHVSHCGHRTNSIIGVDLDWTDNTTKQRLNNFIANAPDVTLSRHVHSIKYKRFPKVVEQLNNDHHTHTSIFTKISSWFKK